MGLSPSLGAVTGRRTPMAELIRIAALFLLFVNVDLVAANQTTSLSTSPSG
jgi:hypothetical protein